MYEEYLAIIGAGLIVAVLNCWNPKLLQERTGGKPNGRPNIILIALVAVLAAMAALYLFKNGLAAPDVNIL